MMVQVPYGKEKVEMDIEIPCEVLVPNEYEVKDGAEILSEALVNPIGAGQLSDFIAGSERLLVIVNDATRPTPTSKVLEGIRDMLVAHRDVKFIIATGAHRAPTEEEYRFIFGGLYDEFKDSIYAHDARRDEDMVYLGRSKNGTEMYLNKMVPEAGNVLVIGSVEPHYFAGYTGGRKSFLPGVASYKTIEMNHKLAMKDGANSLALDGNPVNEDMIDAISPNPVDMLLMICSVYIPRSIWERLSEENSMSWTRAMLLIREWLSSSMCLESSSVVLTACMERMLDMTCMLFLTRWCTSLNRTSFSSREAFNLSSASTISVMSWADMMPTRLP